jgi:hypothetical protein
MKGMKQIDAGVLNVMKGIHHESKTALARHDTPQITHRR